MKLGVFLIILGIAIFLAIGYVYYLDDKNEEEFEPPESSTPPPEPVKDPDLVEESPVSNNPEMSIRDLDLPKRAVNALEDVGIQTVDQLNRELDDITSISGIGEKYAEEIEEQLKEL